MDSTAEHARNAKRARLTPSADLISGLDDDVLLRVLGLMNDARDAVRTAALSRRWLRLWTRVPALRFASRPASNDARGAERRAALDQYVSFVNGVLSRRTQSDCAIETLSISYNSGPACNEEELMILSSVDAAQGWIRYAFQHGVKSFILDLPPNVFEHIVTLDELPIPVRLETMRLALGSKMLRFPTTMKFASLTDLSLEEIQIATGSAHLLGRLVSSASCPRLQKLRMRMIFLHAFYEEMRLEADVLSELWMEHVQVLMSLKLTTPRLRVLHISKCSHQVLSVSAPRLEELAICQLGYPPMWLQVDGDLPCVTCIQGPVHRLLPGWQLEQNAASKGGKQMPSLLVGQGKLSAIDRIRPTPYLSCAEHGRNQRFI